MPKSEVLREDSTEWKFDQTVFCFVLIQTTNFILSWPWVKSYTCKYLKLPLIFLIHSLIDFLSNYFHPMYLIIIRDEGRTKCLHPHPFEHCGSCPSLININASREVSQTKTNCFNVKSLHSSFFWCILTQFWSGVTSRRALHILKLRAPLRPGAEWLKQEGRGRIPAPFYTPVKSLQPLSSVHYSANATLSKRNSLLN